MGRWIGLVLFGTIGVLGMIKCIALMRRQTTSTICVLSLLFFVFVWLTGMIIEAVSPGYGPDTPVVKSLVGILIMIVAFTGLILGIVGLATHGPYGVRFVQGRKQAAWGIALNGVLVAVFLTSIGMGLWRRSRANAEIMPSPGASEIRDYIDVENNFSIGLPGDRWKQGNAKSLGESVRVLLSKSRPEMYQMVICDEIGENRILDLDSASAAWKSGIQTNTKSVSFTPDKHETFPGGEFVHFTATAALPSLESTVSYDCWITIQAGRCYQMMTYGSRKYQLVIESCGRYVAQSFRIPNPNQKKPQLGSPLEDVQDRSWGFSTKLVDLGWKSWPGADKNFPGAVFGAYHSKDSFLGVVPMPVQTTPVDLPTAAAALLLANGELPWDKSSGSRKSIELKGAEEAIHISFDQDRDGVPIHYEARVVRAGKRYLLLLAWANSKVQKDTRFLVDALDAISIDPLQQLPELTAESPEHRRNMALCLHQCGLAACGRKELAQAAALFQESFAISQYNPRTLESVAYTLGEVGQPQAGLDFLKKHDALFPADQALSFLRGQLEVTTGDLGGVDHLLVLFNDGYRNEDDLFATMGILLEQNRAEDAVKMITHFLKDGGSPRVRRWQAIACDSAGDTPRALEILEKLVNEPPFDAETGYRYGETANNADMPDKATAIVARLIKEGHDGARARMIEGWAHAGRKEWREAKASFELAAKSAPNESSIVEAIARASSVLGEGDNSSLKNPIPALKLPQDLQSRIAKAADIPPSDGAGAQYLARVTVYQFSKEVPLTTTAYQDIRLLDAGSIRDFSTLTFPFDPLTENIYVNSVVVTNPDGTEAASGKPEEQYIVDESSSSAMATQRKQLRVAVPGLKAGRTLHVVVTRREKSKDPAFPFLRKVVASRLPSNLEAVVVMGDPAAFKISGNAAFEKTAKVSRSDDVWQAVVSPVPQYFEEDTLPLVDTFLPVVNMGDAKANWAGVAAEYGKDLADRLEPEASVTARAHQIADPCKTNIEKIRALARHVQKEITYQGLEFGRRARRPNAASQVLACHYGDCKDQALFLHQLLKAVGIPSNLALISTEHDVIEDLPTLDQFNHMIVHVPELKSAFIDTTGTYNPAGYLPPDLYSKKALVLVPGKPAIVGFPDSSLFPADEIRIDRQVTFDDGGSALVVEKLGVEGYYAAYLRDYLAGQSKDQRLASFQGMLREKSSARLEELEVSGLDETGGPISFNLRYRVPSSEGVRRLPAVFEENVLGVTYGKSRHHPFQLFHEMKIDSRTKFNLPAPLGPDSLAAFTQRGNGPFLKWEMLPTSGNTINFKAVRPRGKFESSEHAAWYESSQSVMKALKTPLR